MESLPISEIIGTAAAAGTDIWIAFRETLSNIFSSGLTWVFDVVLAEYLGVDVPLWLRAQSEASADWMGIALLAGLALLTIGLLLRRGNSARSPALPLGIATRRPRVIGYLSAGLLVAFLGGWSMFAPLASAALAPGIVSPEGNRQLVEHLEGGIVKTIHVREGDTVEEGDPLVTLQDVHARSQYKQLRDRLVHLLAVEARLQAERLGRRTLAVSAELADIDDPTVRRAIDAQTELFESRLLSQTGRERILESRVEQLHQQNAGLKNVTVAREEQIALMRQEIDSVQKLYDDGLERLPRLLNLRRGLAEIEAELALNHATIAENLQKIGETELQLLTMREQRAEEASGGLAEVERQLTELRSQLQLREDIMKRTVIRAPVAGSVLNIQPTTVTGVIGPGEAILEIVPDAPTLVVDAKVKPTDIDRVYAGMQARVILSAYAQRNQPLIHGTLRTISADRLIEDATGDAFYLAKVDVNKEDLIDLPEIRMIPGMPAEIMLLDSEQTLLEYLVGPLMQSFDRSFRES